MSPGARLRGPALAVALVAALFVLLWPLLHATWLSFTPGELLDPPAGLDWSLRWYQAFFRSPRWMAGLHNSMVVAAIAVPLSLVAGGALALGLAHRRLRGLEAAAWLVTLPLFVPPVVLGMALLPFMRAVGLWGGFLSIGAAHALLSLPVVALVVRQALEAADPDLALAARGLGASRLSAFRRVTLPIALPAVAVGGVVAFVFSLNEFVIALFLATPATDTLPKVIWPNLRYTLTPLVAAASTLTVLATVGGLLAVLAIRAGLRRIGAA